MVQSTSRAFLDRFAETRFWVAIKRSARASIVTQLSQAH
ncbi:hypothetical protein SBA5_330072 [Candidatus Sulfotelmatomonas gaucii]|uniref:Uncharacterized protein n=1 Tax=Candidatus Sulfuritelmatomonas gaucii TaxID=2043161 RepID=A0A2N9LFI2_9BACT|nr:hypothetical protein SBA5_330072 [Candidatus Sulfotelmatomonas gaucii]